MLQGAFVRTYFERTNGRRCPGSSKNSDLVQLLDSLDQTFMEGRGSLSGCGIHTVTVAPLSGSKIVEG